MANDKEEERLPKRRPFTFDITENRLNGVVKAYDRADQYFFKKVVPDKKRKRRFI